MRGQRELVGIQVVHQAVEVGIEVVQVDVATAVGLPRQGKIREIRQTEFKRRGYDVFIAYEHSQWLVRNVNQIDLGLIQELNYLMMSHFNPFGETFVNYWMDENERRGTGKVSRLSLASRPQAAI